MSSRKRLQGLVAAAAIAVVCAGAASPARSAPVEPKWLAAAEAAQPAVVASLKDMVLIDAHAADRGSRAVARGGRRPGPQSSVFSAAVSPGSIRSCISGVPDSLSDA
jgi:hypothetical protein